MRLPVNPRKQHLACVHPPRVHYNVQYQLTAEIVSDGGLCHYTEITAVELNR